MKKILAFAVSLILILALFASCSKTENKTNTDKIRIITTIFPEYDWVKNITENIDNIEITMLISNGVDLHSYQPSATDIMEISECDLLIYIGGESDSWVKDAISSSTIDENKTLNLMNVISDNIKEEELVSGMQSEEDEEDSDVPEYDEHIWLSIKNAVNLCTAITDKLCEIDTVNATTYKTNSEEYISRLKQLDESYASAISNAKNNTILVADRFPFRYLTDDYNIEYYAAFAGCNTESTASFETISFLTQKTDELNLKYIITLENSKTDIASTIVENSTVKPQIMSLDSMQSVTLDDYNNGTTYISIAEQNLEVLKTVLS